MEEAREGRFSCRGLGHQGCEGGGNRFAHLELIVGLGYRCCVLAFWVARVEMIAEFCWCLITRCFSDPH